MLCIKVTDHDVHVEEPALLKPKLTDGLFGHGLNLHSAGIKVQAE